MGGPGPPHTARRTSHKKEKCKLGGSHILSLYVVRYNYPSAVAPVAAREATLVRLCWNLTVFAELDGFRRT